MSCSKIEACVRHLYVQIRHKLFFPSSAGPQTEHDDTTRGQVELYLKENQKAFKFFIPSFLRWDYKNANIRDATNTNTNTIQIQKHLFNLDDI